MKKTRKKSIRPKKKAKAEERPLAKLQEAVLKSIEEGRKLGLQGVGTSFRFLKHLATQYPKIVWRIAIFDAGTADIREQIILPLAEIIEKSKSKNITLEEKELNNFKLILFWPELVLKLRRFLIKAAAQVGVTAVQKFPKLYRQNKSGDLDKVKEELRQLILIKFWSNVRTNTENKDVPYLNRLKKAMDHAFDFQDQPELKAIAQTLKKELGFDRLQEALALVK